MGFIVISDDYKIKRYKSFDSLRDDILVRYIMPIQETNKLSYGFSPIIECSYKCIFGIYNTYEIDYEELDSFKLGYFNLFSLRCYRLNNKGKEKYNLDQGAHYIYEAQLSFDLNESSTPQIGSFRFLFIDNFTFFIETIIPLLNKRIKEGVTADKINYFYYLSMLKSKGCINNIESNLYDLIADIESTKYGNNSFNLYNNINSFVLECLGINGISLYTKMNWGYYSDDIYKYHFNINLYRSYVIDEYCKNYHEDYSLINNDFSKIQILMDIIVNYDQKKFNEGWEHFSLDNFERQRIYVTPQICQLYNFLKNFKYKEYEDGITRVGRDDIGWNETTYIIENPYGYQPTKYLMKLINSFLHASLEYKPELSIYIYTIKTEPEYIAGCGRRKIMSSVAESERKRIDLLLHVFKKLTNENDYKKILGI